MNNKTGIVSSLFNVLLKIYFLIKIKRILSSNISLAFWACSYLRGPPAVTDYKDISTSTTVCFTSICDSFNRNNRIQFRYLLLT